MTQKSRNKNLLKERLTMLLVVFFCFFISNSTYFTPIQGGGKDQMEKSQEAESSSSQDQTFLDVDVDAVVPFSIVLEQGCLHLIYETIGFKNVGIQVQAPMARYPSHFLEILLECIISPNAP
ncbi:hypothetical protein QWY93_06420 [Echinicola jeungdonensis]|uniref:Uncharacterized protein n=1 Tax=Echinicola jeungdonensis TaxID=709343 RepID=A0ABV5J1V5_9BACT|nr:hypothetical protein [Echinicola jeungdonensis]MDN3668956.1 hypothetical protein [Echinicola jeungdonensis]